MKLFVGLGNPGSAYASNRHNIGFMAADEIAQRFSFSTWNKKFQGLLCESSMGGEKILLLKPQTYMNLSGESVAAAARFYKIPVEQVIVMHDELDLPLGKLRVKQGGSAGGHNGLKSIDAHIGQNYYRVRIGIGHPGTKDLVSDYVLSNFAKAEMPLAEKMIESIAAYIELLVKDDAAGFRNKIALAALS